MTAPVCDEAVNLVKHFEGLRLSAYKCPAGVWTIGYGHTAGVKEGQTITADQANAFLEADLTAAAAQVDKLVKVPLTPQQRGALASFVFNLGSGSLQSSTLLRLLNQGDYAGAAGEFGRWVYATVNGVKTQLPGLVKRRAAEAELFEGSTGSQPQDTVTTADRTARLRAVAVVAGPLIASSRAASTVACQVRKSLAVNASPIAWRR